MDRECSNYVWKALCSISAISSSQIKGRPQTIIYFFDSRSLSSHDHELSIDMYTISAIP